MAIEEHKQLILQGVSQWNTWRRNNHALNLTPDLSNIDLHNANLIGANFAFTNFTGTNLAFTQLGGANFVGANLTEAIFRRCNLSDADLTQANLVKADLTEAILIETLLKDTNFTGTVLAHTVLAYLDLRGCKNLNMVTHKAPSTLGIDTLIKSKGAIPIAFLRGVGIPESFIAYIRSLNYDSMS